MTFRGNYFIRWTAMNLLQFFLKGPYSIDSVTISLCFINEELIIFKEFYGKKPRGNLFFYWPFRVEYGVQLTYDFFNVFAEFWGFPYPPLFQNP